MGLRCPGLTARREEGRDHAGESHPPGAGPTAGTDPLRYFPAVLTGGRARLPFPLGYRGSPRAGGGGRAQPAGGAERRTGGSARPGGSVGGRGGCPVALGGGTGGRAVSFRRRRCLGLPAERVRWFFPVIN